MEIISLVNAKPTAQKTASQQLLGDASSLPKYCPNAFEDPDHNLFSNVKSYSNNEKCYYSLPTVLGDKQYTEKVNVRFASSKLKESVHDEGAVINEDCMVSVNDVQKLVKENRIAARYSTDSLLYELYNYLETFRTHYIKEDKYYLYDNIPGKNSWDAQVSISENHAWREKQKFETHSHGSKVSVCEDQDDSESDQKCEHFNYIKLIRFSIPLKCQKVWYPEEDRIYYFWNFTYGFPYGKQPTRTIKEWSMEFEDDRETCYGTVADKTGNDQYRVAADFCRVYLSIASQGPVSISERLRFFYEEYPTVSVLIFLMFGLACLWTFYRLTKRVVPYKKGFDQAKQFYVETIHGLLQ